MTVRRLRPAEPVGLATGVMTGAPVGRATGVKTGAPVGRATGVTTGAPVGRATGVTTGAPVGRATGIGLTAAKKPGELKELTGGRCWTEGPKPPCVFTGEATGLLTELLS